MFIGSLCTLARIVRERLGLQRKRLLSLFTCMVVCAMFVYVHSYMNLTQPSLVWIQLQPLVNISVQHHQLMQRMAADVATLRQHVAPRRPTYHQHQPASSSGSVQSDINADSSELIDTPRMNNNNNNNTIFNCYMRTCKVQRVSRW